MGVSSRQRASGRGPRSSGRARRSVTCTCVPAPPTLALRRDIPLGHYADWPWTFGAAHAGPRIFKDTSGHLPEKQSTCRHHKNLDGTTTLVGKGELKCEGLKMPLTDRTGQPLPRPTPQAQSAPISPAYPRLPRRSRGASEQQHFHPGYYAKAACGVIEPASLHRGPACRWVTVLALS